MDLLKEKLTENNIQFKEVKQVKNCLHIYKEEKHLYSVCLKNEEYIVYRKDDGVKLYKHKDPEYIYIYLDGLMMYSPLDNIINFSNSFKKAFNSMLNGQVSTVQEYFINSGEVYYFKEEVNDNTREHLRVSWPPHKEDEYLTEGFEKGDYLRNDWVQVKANLRCDCEHFKSFLRNHVEKDEELYHMVGSYCEACGKNYFEIDIAMEER